MAILEHFALKQLYVCDAASANEHIFYTITDVQMYNFTIVAGIGKYPMQKLVGLLLEFLLVLNAGQ